MNQERLKELLHYDPDTGVFTWLQAVRSVKAGDVAGRDHHRGYRQIGIDGEVYMAHRLAWLYVNGEFPQEQIDHINHKRNDNRLANLRPASAEENSRNQSPRKTNKSGFAGVHWQENRNRWQVTIRANGKMKHLGRYTSLMAAVNVRRAAELKYGYHENHGRISAQA